MSVCLFSQFFLFFIDKTLLERIISSQTIIEHKWVKFMQAVLSHEPGGPEKLTLKQLDIKEPLEGEVRIKVKAAGVNFPDNLIIRDLYQIKPTRPFSPGGEISGVVEALGDGVSNFKIGDRVLATPGYGGFVTHLNINASEVKKIPDRMSFQEAACFVFTYGTSHYALMDRAKLKKGETLLISGASGGVGIAAIEIGKAIGAHVIATVSNQRKADFCSEVGADETLIYPENIDRKAQKELSAKIKNLSGTNGIDVVYDAVGGNYAEPFIRTLGWNGRFLVVGFPAGIPSIPLNLALLKSCQIIGVFWGAFTKRFPQKHQSNLEHLFKLYLKGRVKPRITAAFDLSDAGRAIEFISSRKALGKVVIDIS